MRFTHVVHAVKKGVFVVFLNGEPWKEIHRSIFGKSPKLNDCVKEDEFYQLEYKNAKKYVLRLLTRRNVSSYELGQKLTRLLVSPLVVSKLKEEFQRLGYINDRDWISHFISSQQQKKQGPKNIALKLKAKGIPEEIFQFLLEEACRSSQTKTIVRLLETKYRKKDLSDYKEKQKVISGLIRRGFDFEMIQQVLN